MSNHMDHLNAICVMKDRFIEWTKEELGKGKEAIDTKEMGEVIDIIKDLYQAEAYCWKSCYYKLLVDEDDTETYDQRRYYNPARTPKSMIKAGMNRGGKRYYEPDWSYNDVYMQEEGKWDKHRTPRTAYDEYTDARRHYTATHEQKDKDEMEMHATKHMLEAISSIKDIWRHAEPEMKERMKSDINALMNSMN